MVQPTIPMPYQPYTPLPSGYTHYHYPTPAAYPPTHPRLTTSLSTAPPCPCVTVSSSTELLHSQAAFLTWDTINNLSVASIFFFDSLIKVYEHRFLFPFKCLTPSLYLMIYSTALISDLRLSFTTPIVG